MQISKEALLKKARAEGYKPEILEKVYRLLDTFKKILSVPYLKERLVLKGGTALNLFCFERLPRLSVDIDLNYIGQTNREKMLEEKSILIDAIHQILLKNQFEPYRSPMYHAGGKMVWFYNSVLGQRGTLEIDINFMYRQPLYPISSRTANIRGHSDWQVPVLDIHELAAGKLSALFNRAASRDLFDAHYLLTQGNLNIRQLREAFVIYLAMTAIDVSAISLESIQYNITDLQNRLLPVMHQKELPRALPKLKLWAENMLLVLRDGLSKILPLENNELEFIKLIREEGKIKPELITRDTDLANKISSHPAILWASKQSLET